MAECLSHYVWKAIAVYILKSNFHIRKREKWLLCEEWKGLSQPRRKMKPHLKTYQIGKVSKLVILLALFLLETGSHTNMEDIFLLKIIPMSTRLIPGLFNQARHVTVKAFDWLITRYTAR